MVLVSLLCCLSCLSCLIAADKEVGRVGGYQAANLLCMQEAQHLCVCVE